MLVFCDSGSSERMFVSHRAREEVREVREAMRGLVVSDLSEPGALDSYHHSKWLPFREMDG